MSFLLFVFIDKAMEDMTLDELDELEDEEEERILQQYRWGEN